MSDPSDDETRLVRRPDPDDVTRVVRREPPDDATRLVQRADPDDATRLVDRTPPDDATRLVQRPEPDDRTVLSDRSTPPPSQSPIPPSSRAGIAPPLLRGGRAAFTPGGVSGEPPERYEIRSAVTPPPVARFQIDARSQRGETLPTRQGAPRSRRTRVIVAITATTVVVLALLGTVGYLLVRAL